MLLALPISGKTSKYRVEVEMPPAKPINGFGVGVDLAGLGMWAAGARFGSLEAMARLNIYEKIFPVFELGIGMCDREGAEQSTKFHSRAPYFRAGVDYCLTKKRNGNRLFLGARYGFSSFNYDYSNADFQDPVYTPVPTPISFEGLKGTAIGSNSALESKQSCGVSSDWVSAFALSPSFPQASPSMATPGTYQATARMASPPGAVPSI